MRIAIVSDIHGNGRAFEAVLSDLEETSPDLILHGGDLADSGSRPVEVLDRIRELGWRGVMGNTDQMLCRIESLETFAAQSSAPPSLWAAIREMARVTRDRLGEERLNWLSQLPRVELEGPVALVHATPASPWRAPSPEASDGELESAYAPLGKSVAVYGHIHCPYVRRLRSRDLGEIVVANSGSVGLPYDGDCRASYLVVDSGNPVIRRVEYDVEAELEQLSSCGLPHADWIGRMLRSASPQMP
jgi:predicted phosphodiesterase